MENFPTETLSNNLERYFDGVDYVYKFGEKIIVYWDAVDVIENLYAENLPLFTHLYKPKLGDVVVDIGAGNGYEIQEFSRLVGDAGKVIAIEADPDCFRRLDKIVNLASLKNVTCVNAAVSDSERDLFLVKNHPGGISNFLHKEEIANSIALRTVPTQTVLETVAISSIDLLKMNIEGHEYLALLGLGDFIERCASVVISCHDFLNVPSSKTKALVTDYLEQKGFLCVSLRSPEFEWERDYVYATNQNFSRQILSESVNSNYFFHKNRSLEKSLHLQTLEELEVVREAYLIAKDKIQGMQEQISVLTTSLANREENNVLIRVKAWYMSSMTVLKKVITGNHYRFNRINETFFVGTTRESGQTQLEILKKIGLLPEDKLIEFGCGALNGSQPIFEYLRKKNYTGVDPNLWLRNLRTVKSFKTLVSRVSRRPRFLTNSTFDAPRDSFGTFNFVFAHSVLSHCCLEQVKEFFRKSRLCLKDGGLIVASWRDAEGNAFGSTGSPGGLDSAEASWVYPGVTYFAKSTLKQIAEENDFSIEFRPDITDLLTQVRPGEFHDWFIAKKRTASN